MKNIIYGTCLLAAGLTTTNLHAREFRPIGYESIAMGGAGVASAKGAMAAYYNPALLGLISESTEVAGTAGAAVREHNLAENLDALNDAQFSAALARVVQNATLVPGPNTAADRQSLTDSQRILSSMAGGKNGLTLLPNAAVGFQIKHFGVGVYGISEGSATAIVDPDHLALSVANGGFYYAYDPATDTYSAITQAQYQASSLEYAVNNQLTYVQLSGMELEEIPVSYGHPIALGAGILSVGGTIKLMSATTYNSRIKVDTTSSAVEDQLNNSDKDSDAVSMDAGLAFTPNGRQNLTLGLVGKYLNSPRFATVVAGEDYQIKPQFRAGLNAAVSSNIDFALDCDLSKNKTFIRDVDTRYIGGGFNVRPLSWFSFRVGAMKNLASANEGTVFTGGVGFGLSWLRVDLALQRSRRKGTLDGEDIPRFARANISIMSRW